MLLNTIRKVLEGGYTVKTAILVILFELPNILGKALPVGLLLGALFTFDKLSKDFELTIFRTAGLSFWRILAPVLALSLMITAFCFFTYDKLIPFSASKLVDIRRDTAPSQYIYTQKDDKGQPTLGVVVSRFNYSNIANVIVLDFSEKNILIYTLYRTFLLQSTRKCLLTNGFGRCVEYKLKVTGFLRI